MVILRLRGDLSGTELGRREVCEQVLFTSKVTFGSLEYYTAAGRKCTSLLLTRQTWFAVSYNLNAV